MQKAVKQSESHSAESDSSAMYIQLELYMNNTQVTIEYCLRSQLCVIHCAATAAATIVT
jgi:hypothetical protein